MSAPETFQAFTPAMQAALNGAWASARAGSLGIGAAAASPATGEVLATGRNRLNETDPGDDVLAGTSLAHAETNVLAKLGYKAHDDVHLATTLQPCVQCLGAIRLSAVTSVEVLAPDPVFRGVESMRDLNPFIARRWPDITQRTVDEWAVFALLGPTQHMLDHPTLADMWTSALPGVAALCRSVDTTFAATSDVVDAAARLWPSLGECVAEVAELAAT